jgi:5-methylcytosine-specific restriction endonuclease McrA
MRKGMVLLLDRNFFPRNLISWKKSVDLVLSRSKAEVVEGVHSKELFAPSVIRLLVWSPNPFEQFKKQSFSKVNVFKRDKWTCQYCGIKCTRSKITIDHIVPKSLGGKTDYLNCTSSCQPCNKYKSNLTLEKAGMRLLSVPRQIEYRDRLPLEHANEEWEKWITL